MFDRLVVKTAETAERFSIASDSGDHFGSPSSGDGLDGHLPGEDLTHEEWRDRIGVDRLRRLSEQFRDMLGRDGDGDGRAVRGGASAKLEVPKFSGDRSQYERWRKKMEIWLRATKTDDAMHGALIIEAVKDDEVSDLLLEIETDRLASPEGSRLIFEILDKKFLREAKDRRCATLLEMLELSRDHRESMDKYLQRKMRVLTRAKTEGNKLDEGVSSRIVLRDARLMSEKMVTTMLKEDYGVDDVKAVLVRLFPVESSSSEHVTSETSVRVVEGR